jgi:hypothetical protein
LELRRRDIPWRAPASGPPRSPVTEIGQPEIPCGCARNTGWSPNRRPGDSKKPDEQGIPAEQMLAGSPGY